MNLATAKHYADKIAAWIEPHCVRIEVAGSIRRGRPVCGDVDLVVVPKVTERKDLVGAVIERRNHCLEFLRGYVKEKNPAGSLQDGAPRFVSGGEQLPGGRENKVAVLQLPKCQLDLWFATEETWGTLLLCRTGSKEHNIWLCNRAADQNGHWNPHAGLTINGVLIPAPTEECIYAALGLEFIAPADREAEWIHKNLEFGL